MADALAVLIVDDSRLVLAQLESIIDGVAGVELVGSAQDGAGAIRQCAFLRPDLVLMDIVMPGLDGLSALRVIRASHPEVRVAMVSSVAGAGTNAEEAFRLGAFQVIGKPFDRDRMEALLEDEAQRLADRLGAV